jgi:hypothetical protein
VPHDEPPRRS